MLEDIKKEIKRYLNKEEREKREKEHFERQMTRLQALKAKEEVKTEIAEIKAKVIDMKVKRRKSSGIAKTLSTMANSPHIDRIAQNIADYDLGFDKKEKKKDGGERNYG